MKQMFFLHEHAAVFNRFRKCGHGFKIVEWKNAQAIAYSYFGPENASNDMRIFVHNHNFNDMLFQSLSILDWPIHGALTHCLCNSDYAIKQSFIPLESVRVPIDLLPSTVELECTMGRHKHSHLFGGIVRLSLNWIQPQFDQTRSHMLTAIDWDNAHTAIPHNTGNCA